MAERHRLPDLPKAPGKETTWRWLNCPGCGRKSAYHPDGGPSGQFHADTCPLEGLYGTTHEWWFEREIMREYERAEAAETRIAELEDEAGRWRRYTLRLRGGMANVLGRMNRGMVDQAKREADGWLREIGEATHKDLEEQTADSPGGKS